jgi:hypothetical protein
MPRVNAFAQLGGIMHAGRDPMSPSWWLAVPVGRAAKIPLLPVIPRAVFFHNIEAVKAKHERDSRREA